ncbi:hypothetical protein [Bacillus suaedaesalsae]|uniref:SMI1/KNR4 family protein n=1 Tax=Bacillus suaedaesalsae TaxID=2810349 RepID=A0ABS2DFR8_9BACI|nr:hypothetical protein [Bacillus suaedaesalsae]MBM6616376.1 hypothetical protein [Bacillus suaedaesalsae]
MLQFGPFITEKEKEKLEPTIQQLIDKIPNDLKGTIHIKDEYFIVKAFGEELSFEYGNERECILELQSTESVPLFVAYNDEDLVLVWDMVYGENLPTFAKEQRISIYEYEEELITSLQAMLKKGWHLPKIELDHVIWCEDCNALFIVDYSGCERVHSKTFEEYNEDMLNRVKKILKQYEQ